MKLIDDNAWAVMTIYGEARGEPSAGKLAVAEVIRNRMRRHYFSDGSAADTCLLADQFSCWSTHDPNRIAMALLDDLDPQYLACKQAWSTSIGSNTVLGAVLYANLAICSPSWATKTQQVRSVAVIGHHTFFVTV